MDQIIPWQRLSDAVQPHYPAPKGAGRRPVGLERMLRIYFLQHWFNLSDPAAEEAIYDSRAMRQFVGIDLGSKPAPDETTICKFRPLMKRHQFGDHLLQLVNNYLDENGLSVSRGTVVDASIIQAPSSAKNKGKARDPDMHHTRKGNQWYFGMKAHIGVDNQNRLIHSVVATPANIHDSAVIDDLLHGDETRIWGDSAYTGQTERIKKAAPHARDFTQNKGSRYRKLTESERLKSRNKSRTRCRVEPPVPYHQKPVWLYQSPLSRAGKEYAHLFVSCALANIVMVKKALMKRRPLLTQAQCA